jgi:hypothetical protein
MFTHIMQETLHFVSELMDITCGWESREFSNTELYCVANGLGLIKEQPVNSLGKASAFVSVASQVSQAQRPLAEWCCGVV